MKSSIIKELIVLLKRDKNQRKKNFFYCQKEVVNAHITYKKKMRTTGIPYRNYYFQNQYEMHIN